MSSRTVAVAGLGNLGLPMARALLDAGWSVTAYDINPDAVAECTRHGASAADSPMDLAGSAVIALVVPDDAAITAVVRSSGLLDAVPAGNVLAVHSTVLPETARGLASDAAERGVDLIDAPVSGGPDRARSGELTLMAGAELAALDRARDYLTTVASDIVHVGPPGAGAAAKLANQLMMFAALAATHEGIEIASRYGLSEADLLRAVRTSTGESWVTREWGFFDRVAAAYDAAGVPVERRPWGKDLDEVVAAAQSVGIEAQLATFLAGSVAAAVEKHARKG